MPSRGDDQPISGTCRTVVRRFGVPDVDVDGDQ